MPLSFRCIAASLVMALVAASTLSAPAHAQAPSDPIQRAAGDNAPSMFDATASISNSTIARPAPAVSAAAPVVIGSTFTVTTVADTGIGSLRAAITSANALIGLDQVAFAIPGAGAHVISLKSALPIMTSPIVLDGSTQPGYAGTPLIVITYSGAGGANGLTLYAGGSVVRGLVISGFPSTGSTTGTAVVLDIAGNNVLEGNYIGLDASGAGAFPNGAVGISIRGGSGYNRIGGLTPQSRNVIAGNGSTGIAISGGSTGHNRLLGNYVGLNAAGTAVIPNTGNNVFISAPDDTIGGREAGARNVIAGSGTGFPDLFIGPSAPRTIIQGNYIGLDATGSTDIGSPSNGINIRSSDNVIGDTTAVGRNVIGGTDRAAIYVFSATALRNRIVGNYLGTDATGTVALGDLDGITLDGVTSNTIGGATAGARNVIAGNPSSGIAVISGASGNTILGNYVGTDVTGFNALANGVGVQVDASIGNVIGGNVVGARNVISGNLTYGIMLNASNSNRISNNYIGTDASGQSDLGNGSDGVFVVGAQDTIGGAAAGNVIAFNDSAGVFIASGANALVRENSLHDNAGLGIDLFPRGITPNDSLDSDSGANGLQNHPELDSLVSISGGKKVYGQLNSKPGTGYTVSLFKSADFDPSHFGEGAVFLYSGTVTTDATGRAPFAFSIPNPDPPAFLSATATDAGGSTSEFSQAMCTSDLDEDGLPDCWETEGWGLDVNSDGLVDLDLYARGARDYHRDLFVEIDAMQGFAPDQAALNLVTAAFDSVPREILTNPDDEPGIKLHCVLDDATIAVVDFTDTWPQFDATKAQWFGTAAERNSTNARYVLQAKRMVYRYCLWGRTYGAGDDTTSGGIARDPTLSATPDFMVSLGSWSMASRTNAYVQAGTFMHELGHTLGLGHGGGDNINYKPNYISVMNYIWELPSTTWQKPGTWPLDYSRVAMGSLDEAHLDETAGFPLLDGIWPAMEVPFTDSLYHTRFGWLKPGEPVDWSGDGVARNTNLNSDLNHVAEDNIIITLNQTLAGHADWPNLLYDFRNTTMISSTAGTASLTAGNAVTSSPEREMTYATYQRILAIPPPRPTGQFVMDGVLDVSAGLVASNGPLHLWAALRDGQLYVATDAPAQSADLFILVAATRGALRSAPGGKAGQVGAFDAVLSKQGTGNASGWHDALERDLQSISVDTAGTVLEGVIDVRLLEEDNVSNLVLAVGRYGSSTGGALLEQIPGGNGDGNLDGAEFVDLHATVGVDQQPEASGVRVSLSAPYPNPIVGSVQFGLTLGSPANVDVSVFDVAGRRVAQLATGRMEAGAHRLVWNPTARTGAGRKQGIYFILARAFGETRTLRVVVLE